ncbi:M24 family metallopeptidase [Dactylosporangium sp. CA-092794]|uniref:M24 family metallopeptidase n=1 Tax=Dactylosporangium sp. CA-092794 TaxID=3239929 RepID=UPI003D8EC8C2
MTVVSVPVFSLAERERRWNLARSFMHDQNIDALLVIGEHEDAGPAPFRLDTWFTNDAPGAIVVFPRNADPVSLAWFPADSAEDARRGTVPWLAPPNRRVGLRHSQGVVSVLGELGLSQATIGVAGLEPYLPYQPEGSSPYGLWNGIQQGCAQASFVPVGLKLARMMMPQSEEEIAVVRHAAGIGDEMAKAMVDAAAPGAAESDVFAAGMAAAHRRGAIVPGLHLATGPQPLELGLPRWSYRPEAPLILADGDVVRSEVFCNFGLRETQHQVTIAIGTVHEDYDRAADIARESYDAGLRTLRPGNAFAEVVNRMRKPLEAAGANPPIYPLIHSLNPIEAIGGGSLLISGDLQLQPGMTFALEPHCILGHRRVSLGGTVIVGEDDAIELNPYTARLLRAGNAT